MMHYAGVTRPRDYQVMVDTRISIACKGDWKDEGGLTLT
jgi:hypothetical protein